LIGQSKHIDEALFCQPYFDVMATLVLELESKNKTVQELFQYLRQELESIQQERKERLYSQEANDTALFAVCAWADEQLMNANWDGVSEVWPSHLLQSSFFGTNLAGVEFFERALQLTNDMEIARGVYAACLAYGFKGKYVYDLKTEELVKQKHQILNQTLSSNHLDSSTQQTFASVSQLMNDQFNTKKSWAWLLKTSTPLLLLCFLAVFLYVLLRGQILSVLGRLAQ
jgi:type IV/VI secretion system ImpK/VasF family protein